MEVMSLPIYQFKELLAITKQFLEQEFDISFEQVIETTAPIALIPKSSPDLSSNNFYSASNVVKEVKTQESLSHNKEDSSVQVVKPDEEETVLFIKLEPIVIPMEDHCLEVRKKISQLFPHYLLQDSIPSDTHAEEVKKGVKSVHRFQDQLILYFDENEEEVEFLLSICRALNIYGYPTLMQSYAKLKNIHWKELHQEYSLKRIIASKASLERSLLNHFVTHDETGVKLSQIPLFFLLPPHDYIKDYKLKAPLWKQLLSFQVQ